MDPWRGDLERYVAALRGQLRDDLVSVVLFGSRASGRATPESDIDLLVIARGLPPGRLTRRTPFVRLARSISSSFADAVSHVLLTPEEAARTKPFYLGLLDAHELIVDEQRFFAEILVRLRRRLAELGARKLVDPDGYEFWDLKPDWKPGDVVTL